MTIISSCSDCGLIDDINSSIDEQDNEDNDDNNRDDSSCGC